MYLLIVVLLLVACAWGMDVHASLYARYGRRTREPRVANRLCESVFDIYRYDIARSDTGVLAKTEHF